MTLLKDLFYLAILFIAMWIAFYLSMRHDSLEQRMVRYDCRLSEFAPDFPPDIRAECRRRALEAYNQRQQQEQ